MQNLPDFEFWEVLGELEDLNDPQLLEVALSSLSDLKDAGLQESEEFKAAFLALEALKEKMKEQKNDRFTPKDKPLVFKRKSVL